MLSLLLGFGKKYIFEIIAGICFLVFMGIVVYVVQNWCNHACRTAKVEAAEAAVALKVCKDQAAKDMAFYLDQQSAWQKQVQEQKEAIERAVKEKEAIVDKGRKSFNQIFKESKANEKQSRERIRAEIRAVDTVTAPVALVREYNEAVAAGPGAAQGNSRGEVTSQDSTGTLGATATFDAVAVAEALIGNIYKYNQLAAQCSTLMEIVKGLEARNDFNTKRTDGPAEAAGGNVSGRTVEP